MAGRRGILSPGQVITSTWRSEVLTYFPSDVAAATRVTVVADPDALLLDDEVITELARRGFDVVPHRDPVEFRFYYESKHRLRWDAGEATSVVVSAPWARQDIGRIPYDLLVEADANGRVLDVSLGSIFPNLASDVLGELDRADLDAVWSVTQGLGRDDLGRNQTRDLVLRAVFKLSAEMITGDHDLIVQLLRLHHAKRAVPRQFATRFAESLMRDGRFSAWPLIDLVASQEAFFRLLQDRWERHLHGMDPRLQVRPDAPGGPSTVNFRSPEVAAVLDNLFLEGRLSPVQVPDPEMFRGHPEGLGVHGMAVRGSAEGVGHLLRAVLDQVPEPGVPPPVWTRFAERWAELVQAADGLPTEELAPVIADISHAQDLVDTRLWDWLSERFGAVVNRSFLPMPTVVHHIPHYLAHRRRPGERVALIVVDGMSLSQWSTIKAVAGDEWMAGKSVNESAVLAWVPTVTSVSRQAMLSGQAPMFFETTVHTTSAEERHWKAFWDERGWRRDRVGFVKQGDGEHEHSLVARVLEAVDSDRVECIAVVINSVDRMVHGASPEGNVLAAAVRQWAANGHIVSLVQGLMDRGFVVGIASDHGNVGAVGQGRPNLGSVPEDQGKRAIVFADRNTMRTAMASLSNCGRWEGHGLPDSMHVLLPKTRLAFSTVGSNVRTHGGASIEEVFVPFVMVTRSA